MAVFPKILFLYMNNVRLRRVGQNVTAHRRFIATQIRIITSEGYGAVGNTHKYFFSLPLLVRLYILCSSLRTILYYRE